LGQSPKASQQELSGPVGRPDLGSYRLARNASRKKDVFRRRCIVVATLRQVRVVTTNGGVHVAER
jgi:hypothetical protein